MTARWQHSCPGSVLLLQVQGVPGGGQGELLVRPNYRAGTEGKTREVRGKTAWLSLVLVACCISLLSYNKSPPSFSRNVRILHIRAVGKYETNKCF